MSATARWTTPVTIDQAAQLVCAIPGGKPTNTNYDWIDKLRSGRYPRGLAAGPLGSGRLFYNTDLGCYYWRRNPETVHPALQAINQATRPY
jgi:hypothetical protein